MDRMLLKITTALSLSLFAHNAVVASQTQIKENDYPFISVTNTSEYDDKTLVVLPQISIKEGNRSLITNNNNNIEIFNGACPYMVPQEEDVPFFLNLTISNKLKKSCKNLSTPEARDALNNIFTNLAYDEAVQLYQTHGDNFIDYFTDSMVKNVTKIVEELLLHESGLSQASKHLSKLAGKDLKANKNISEWALANLPKNIIDLIALKPITSYINKEYIGPKIVAPYAAYGVNQLDLGSLIQDYVLAPIYKKLQSYDKILLKNKWYEGEKYKSKISEHEISILECRDDLPNLEPNISKSENKVAEAENKLESKKNDIYYNDNHGYASWLYWKTGIGRDNIPEEIKKGKVSGKRDRLVNQKSTLESKVINLEENIESIKVSINQIYQQVESYKDLERADHIFEIKYEIRSLKIANKTIQDLMEPCLHIKPGMFSDLFTLENASIVTNALITPTYRYFDMCGVISPMNELKLQLSTGKLITTMNDTMGILEKQVKEFQELKDSNIIPDDHELDGLSTGESALKYFSTAASFAVKATVTAHSTMSLHERMLDPIVQHKKKVCTILEDTHSGFKRACVLPNALIGTAKWAAASWVVNMLTTGVLGYPILPTDWYYPLGMAVVEEVTLHYYS